MVLLFLRRETGKKVPKIGEKEALNKSKSYFSSTLQCNEGSLPLGLLSPINIHKEQFFAFSFMERIFKKRYFDYNWPYVCCGGDWWWG